MRPVPGLVDARSRGRTLGPRSGVPRILLAVRPCRFRLVRDWRGSVRPPFNGQLRTGTDKGNPTV
ncbi:hypothetical protein JYU34_020757 [Plutella xylostella]|uniref:Uncharacterized protein n=1 Tax=Plutella xylostella TaxID=51655 RepID=A0ABQ7PV11_PLUXY|nr:hypothetical protein JYU34_020757 [Plutella xylostella]